MWLIALDAMNNFNEYFPKDNPKELTDKFSRQARMSKRRMKMEAMMENEEARLSQQGEEEVMEPQLIESWV